MKAKHLTNTTNNEVANLQTEITNAVLAAASPDVPLESTEEPPRIMFIVVIICFTTIMFTIVIIIITSITIITITMSSPTVASRRLGFRRGAAPSKGIGRQGIGSFCKEIPCSSTIPCRPMPI